MGGKDGGRLRSVGGQWLVRVEMFVVVMVDIGDAQLSQSPQTEGGVTKACSEHIHGPRALQ